MNQPKTGLPGEILWPYTVAELWADGVIHVIGLVLVLVGAAAFVFVRPDLSVATAWAVAAYLVTLALSIGCSAAYNIWPVSRIKWMLRRFDHAAIFLLIAGTYSPFMTHLGAWWLMTIVWMVAALGSLLKFVMPGRYDRLTIVLYLLLAWSGVLLGNQLVSGLPLLSFKLLVAGGIIYSAGVVFHLWERLRFQNAIWHAFVLTAATVHYGAVWAVVAA